MGSDVRGCSLSLVPSLRKTMYPARSAALTESQVIVMNPVSGIAASPAGDGGGNVSCGVLQANTGSVSIDTLPLVSTPRTERQRSFSNSTGIVKIGSESGVLVSGTALNSRPVESA